MQQPPQFGQPLLILLDPLTGVCKSKPQTVLVNMTKLFGKSLCVSWVSAAPSIRLKRSGLLIYPGFRWEHHAPRLIAWGGQLSELGGWDLFINYGECMEISEYKSMKEEMDRILEKLSKAEKKGRFQSLIITKIQEAGHWVRDLIEEAEQEKK